MKRLTNHSKSLTAILGSILLAGAARAQNQTFPGNVTVTSNLTVNGSESVTNIIPSQSNASILISGSPGYGATNAGNVTISGGTGASENGGNVVLQGGHASYGDSAGSVILQGGSPGYGAVAGTVQLLTPDGTTRFTLQHDGTLNANGNAIINIGTLSVTNIAPSQADTSIAISGAASDGVTNGGSVVISGGSGAYPGVLAGDVVLQGGNGGYATPTGNVILRNGFPELDCAGPTCSFGSIALQTYEGTTRFWLQNNGTLNGNDNYLINTKVPAQGDLSMGPFTN